MYNRPLKTVWTPRLSPVMRSQKMPWIRKPLSTPITAKMGMGSDIPLPVSSVRPRNRALWSDLYRIGAAGALSRVKPYGPNAFSGVEGNASGRIDMRPFFYGMAGAIALMAAKNLLQR